MAFTNLRTISKRKSIIETLQYIILLLTFLSFVIQILFWARIFSQLKEASSRSDVLSEKEGVSVIICGRNEASNIKKYLPSILTQDYPVFEVLFVNDHSSDESDVVLASLQAKFAQLKIVQPTDFLPGKKQAILAGIKNAAHEILIFTDADCRPSSRHWIRELIPKGRDIRISLGFAPFFPTNHFVNRFARYDGVLIFLLYGSLASLGIPYMGVGRNLAYKKSIFSEASFSTHADLLGGDDDLMINQQASARNTAVVFNRDSLVFSHSERSLLSFIKQKRRHLSTAWRYNLKHQMILITFSGAHWFFYVGLIICWFYIGWFVLIGYFIKMYFTVRQMKDLYRICDYKDLLIWIFILDLIYLFYYPLVSILMYFPAPKKWR